MELRHGQDRLTGNGVFNFETEEIEDAQIELRIADLSVIADKRWPESWEFFQRKHHIHGSLSAQAAISGPLNRPRGTADISARKISIDQNRFGDAKLRLHSDGRKITVETLEIRHSDDRLVLNGSFDFSSADFDNVELEVSIADIADYTHNLASRNQPMSGTGASIMKLRCHCLPVKSSPKIFNLSNSNSMTSIRKFIPFPWNGFLRRFATCASSQKLRREARHYIGSKRGRKMLREP